MSDLAALFAQDPLTYTKENGELEKIITEFRANRHRFLAGNVKAGSTKPKSEKQKAMDELAEKVGGNLSLDGLKLEL